MASVIRQGRVTAKANKTDPQFQTWAVREWDDGSIEQYLVFGADPGRWVKCPDEYRERIVWDGPLDAAP